MYMYVDIKIITNILYIRVSCRNKILYKAMLYMCIKMTYISWKSKEI